MPSRNVILVVHMIKFGLPFGLLMAAANLIFRDGVGMAEAVGKSIVMMGISLLWGLVLGLIRISKNDV